MRSTSSTPTGPSSLGSPTTRQKTVTPRGHPTVGRSRSTAAFSAINRCSSWPSTSVHRGGSPSCRPSPSTPSQVGAWHHRRAPEAYSSLRVRGHHGAGAPAHLVGPASTDTVPRCHHEVGVVRRRMTHRVHGQRCRSECGNVRRQLGNQIPLLVDARVVCPSTNRIAVIAAPCHVLPDRVTI